MPLNQRWKGRVRKVLAYAWASPYSLLGLLIGLLGLCTGGKAQLREGVLEFHGGAVQWLIRKTLGQAVLAMTLGHTVIGQTADSLAIAHDHEMVHVRQFERWGPFMGPAYLGCSVVLWLRGKRAYRDNPFEREAYGDNHPS